MIPEFNTCRACDGIFDVLKEPLCTNCAATIISERDELEAENATLRARVGRLEALAKEVEYYLEHEGASEDLYLAWKALEAEGAGE